MTSGEPTRNELSGTVYGHSVQAREIRGDVHVYQAGSPVPHPPHPPPSQLPPLTELTGRADALLAMDGARASRVIVVTGSPGVGKSALAVSWGHRVRADFPDGILFADLHGYAPDGPASPGRELGRFLRALGTDPQAVPADLAELTGLYRSLMVDRRMLVVLDDALTAAQVIPLLPSSPASVAVVTSRARLGGLVARGARAIQLDRLDADAALALLAQTVGEDRVRAESQAAKRLVDLCGRLPLAICVAGARLAARTRWPVSEMVQALAHERQRLAALGLEDDMAIRPALDVSYEALDPAAARLYRVLGLFPGTRFDSGVAAAAAAIPQAEARRLLGLLTDVNLLDDAEEGQYRFHDLTRLHAREMCETREPEVERSVIVRRMLDWFLVTAGAASAAVTPYRHDLSPQVRYAPAEPVEFASAGVALDWLDRELPSVIAIVRLAASQRQYAVAWQLADAMWPLFLYQGHYGERLELDQLALGAARDGGDATGQAKMLNRLGLAVMDLGRHEEAKEYFEQAITFWERLGDADRIAGGQRRLGLVAIAQGQPAVAIDLLTLARNGYAELGATRKAALALGDLGTALMRAGRPRDAIARLEEAGTLLAQATDPYSQARVVYRIGLAYQQAGDVPTAAECLRRALRAMRDISSPKGEADGLIALADLALRAGQRDEARDLLTDARSILVAAGSPRAAEVAESLARLGEPGPA